MPQALPRRASGDPIFTRVQRLTNSQWERAVTDILRLDAPTHLSDAFQVPVVGATDFTNNELVLYVGEREVVDYEAAAEAAAALATGSPAALDALYPGTDAEGFVQSFGLRAFRRPLLDEEVAKYVEMFNLGETLYGPGFGNGAALVIRAMLQSPHFLYRTELGPVGEPLDGYEVAAKLSFWLLGTTPSDALLEAASRGDLDSLEGVESVARDMLAAPASAQVMFDFHQQLYDLELLRHIVKDAPEFSESMHQEIVEAAAAFFDGVYQRDEGLTQILTSTRGYAGPELAALHGLQVAGNELEEVDFGPQRIGFFMQPPFLTAYANNLTPDSIHRGIALNFNVLCAALPPAPLITLPQWPAPEPGQTNRQRVTAATTECGAACHDVYINPLGFAFEHFDGMGRWRDTDNGQPVDASGRYPLASGIEAFRDASELMQILSESSEAHLCYCQMLTSYALGRDIAATDEALLEALADVSHAGSLKEIILALVKDPAFRVRQEGLQ